MTRSSQLPSHRPLCFRTHIEIKSQVRHATLGETQVEPKTCRTLLTFDAKAFELADRCMDEIPVYMRRSKTCFWLTVSQARSLLSHQFALDLWVLHDPHEFL